MLSIDIQKGMVSSKVSGWKDHTMRFMIGLGSGYISGIEVVCPIFK